MDEIELVKKHMIRQFMKDQFNELKEDKQETNNSFVFLENSTLNMLIVSLLMNGQRQTDEEVNEEFEVKVLEGLDHMIADSKKDFEEILRVLNKLNG